MAKQLVTLVIASSAAVDDAKSEVERVLGAAFTPRDSSYRGGAYWMGSTDREGETIIVQRNAELEGPVEPAELPTIVYVQGTARAPELTARLEGGSFVVIRQEGWPDTG
jgi:hypothetical protein